MVITVKYSDGVIEEYAELKDAEAAILIRDIDEDIGTDYVINVDAEKEEFEKTYNPKTLSDYKIMWEVWLTRAKLGNLSSRL